MLINAAEATDPWHVLQAIASRAAIPRQFASELKAPFERVDPLAEPRALSDLRQALDKEKRHLTVLVDGPIEPAVAGALFGRMRDAIFALPMTWVVVAHEQRLVQYLTPPADVFFEAVERIEDLGPADVFRLLELRGAGDLADQAGAEIGRAQDGTPRHALALARMQLRQPSTDALAAHARATDGLTRTAQMLLAEMRGRGAVAATDEGLRGRLGVTDRHIRRGFAELEAAKLVEIVPGSRPGPGRPATTYAVTPLGAFTDGTLIWSNRPVSERREA